MEPEVYRAKRSQVVTQNSSGASAKAVPVFALLIVDGGQHYELTLDIDRAALAVLVENGNAFTLRSALRRINAELESIVRESKLSHRSSEAMTLERRCFTEATS